MYSVATLNGYPRRKANCDTQKARSQIKTFNKGHFFPKGTHFIG